MYAEGWDPAGGAQEAPRSFRHAGFLLDLPLGEPTDPHSLLGALRAGAADGWRHMTVNITAVRASAGWARPASPGRWPHPAPPKDLARLDTAGAGRRGADVSQPRDARGPSTMEAIVTSAFDAIPTYPKIYPPLMLATSGPDRKKPILGAWRSPEIGALAGTKWLFTEKVNGTNIRVYYDGHRVHLTGRTNDALIPAEVTAWIDEHLPVEAFEQTFGAQPVTLFGEGYGPRIIKGSGVYGTKVAFVLFDVRIGEVWLQRHNVADVANKLNIDVVPLIATTTLHAGIGLITNGLQSLWGDFLAEGIVGHPATGLLDRQGERIAVKILTRDYHRRTP